MKFTKDPVDLAIWIVSLIYGALAAYFSVTLYGWSPESFGFGVSGFFMLTFSIWFFLDRILV